MKPQADDELTSDSAADAEATRARPLLGQPRGFATRSIHLGYDPLATDEKAINPPVFMTASYAFESAESAAETYAGSKPGYIYGRTKNPTQALLEERVAALESAEAGVAFASGMAAIASLCWTVLRSDDRVIVDHLLYGNTYSLFRDGLTRFGVDVDFLDFTELGLLEEAITSRAKKAPRMIYFETPANPTLRVIDIGAAARLAKRHGALTAVDSTLASPAVQRPLELGAHVVVHSATKFLSGHGDVIGGLLLGSSDLMNQVRMHGLRYLTGAAMAPHTAFLVLRGLKTLALRMERHSSNALAIAKLLERSAGVASVFYPGLPSHPQYATARKQMTHGGGLVAFDVEGGYAAGVRLMNAVRIATRAVSLGEAETLIQHPASMTHAQYNPAERQRLGLTEGLIRMSVGLEDLSDIEEDLLQALQSTAS